MKRLLVAAVALIAALSTGCSSVTTASTANLAGTYDLAIVGDLLFITSSYRNELRVLDLAASPRDFVRAPNPLEPLSIPVLDSPTELARDVRYDANGAELDGPYVYARGVGSPEISIVGADRKQLKELNRVVAASTVTALASAGPANGQGPSTLYYATWDGTRGTLWSVSVPAADSLTGATLSSTVVVSNDNESIVSLAVMPDGHSLAVATRMATGTGGRTVLLDLNTLTTKALDFPAPVRRVLTHAAYASSEKDGAGNPIIIPAGKRVFGVLDEQSCGGRKQCSGLLAVEADTGQIARDATGFSMVPLTFGRGLINGVTLVPKGRVVLPSAGAQTLNLLGIATTTGDSNQIGGEIYFFDGDGVRQIASTDLGPSLTSGALQDSTGAVKDYGNGPTASTFVLGNGAVQSETVAATFQGIIPGLNDIPSSDADGQRFVASGIDVEHRVAVGDLIQILAPDASCTEELTVSQVEADAVDTTTPIPPACANRTGFTVRAAGAEPYVVEGSVSGYLGRVGPGETFTYPAPLQVASGLPACADSPAYCVVPCPVGQQAACAPDGTRDYSAAYYFHAFCSGSGSTCPPPFNPRQPELSFDFPAGQTTVPQRGDQYIYTLASGFLPLLIALDPSVYAGWYLPGAVAYYKKTTQNGDGTQTSTDLVYVTYPSVQGLIEFDPTTIVPNAANASTIVGYR